MTWRHHNSFSHTIILSAGLRLLEGGAVRGRGRERGRTKAPRAGEVTVNSGATCQNLGSHWGHRPRHTHTIQTSFAPGPDPPPGPAPARIRRPRFDLPTHPRTDSVLEGTSIVSLYCWQSHMGQSSWKLPAAFRNTSYQPAVPFFLQGFVCGSYLVTSHQASLQNQSSWASASTAGQSSSGTTLQVSQALHCTQ